MITIGGVIVSILRFTESLVERLTLLGYGSLLRYRRQFGEWRPCRSSHQLLYHGLSSFLGHGSSVSSCETSNLFSNKSSKVALGEMVSQFPIPGGQFALADRFVSRELGFAMGILYWYK